MFNLLGETSFEKGCLCALRYTGNVSGYVFTAIQHETGISTFLRSGLVSLSTSCIYVYAFASSVLHVVHETV